MGGQAPARRRWRGTERGPLSSASGGRTPLDDLPEDFRRTPGANHRRRRATSTPPRRGPAGIEIAPADRGRTLLRLSRGANDRALTALPAEIKNANAVPRSRGQECAGARATVREAAPRPDPEPRPVPATPIRRS